MTKIKIILAVILTVVATRQWSNLLYGNYDIEIERFQVLGTAVLMCIWAAMMWASAIVEAIKDERKEDTLSRKR